MSKFCFFNICCGQDNNWYLDQVLCGRPRRKPMVAIRMSLLIKNSRLSSPTVRYPHHKTQPRLCVFTVAVVHNLVLKLPSPSLDRVVDVAADPTITYTLLIHLTAQMLLRMIWLKHLKTQCRWALRLYDILKFGSSYPTWQNHDDEGNEQGQPKDRYLHICYTFGSAPWA